MLQAHLSQVGGCGVELSLIEDYLLNYSTTASVKQPWIKETSARQTFGVRRCAQLAGGPRYGSLLLTHHCSGTEAACKETGHKDNKQTTEQQYGHGKSKSALCGVHFSVTLLFLS